MDVRHQLFPAVGSSNNVLHLYVLVFMEGLLYLWSPFSPYFLITANVREISVLLRLQPLATALRVRCFGRLSSRWCVSSSKMRSESRSEMGWFSFFWGFPPSPLQDRS